MTSSLRLGVAGARCYGRTNLDRGQSAFVALSWGSAPPASVEEAQAQLDDTVAYWRDWLSTATFPDHPWRSYIERSALTLKGLSYAPTGAIMAAATTSLPETPGGARNWDYRYTWIRDSSFMLRALHRLGLDWEALEYFAFVLEAVTSGTAHDWGLQIMYGIGGEKDLTEHTLDHLTGYRDSPPVRVGNGAWDQHQNDVWGMLVDAVDTHMRHGAPQIVKQTWEGLASFVDAAITHAGDPDQGIWEIRGDPQQFTASKVLCWVAMDRGSNLARARQDHQRAERWRQAADDLKAEILDKGVDERGRFRQHYANDELDASLLLIPIMEFLPPDDATGAHHRAGHRRRADRGRPGPALQGRHHRHRLRGQGGDLHHLLVLAGHRPGHDRRTGPGPGPGQEAPVLRRAAAAVCRGDRCHHRRASRQLPPSLHPPGPHRRPRTHHRRRRPGRPGQADRITPGRPHCWAVRTRVEQMSREQRSSSPDSEVSLTQRSEEMES